jgi:malonyl-CoA/methylmalonyl-CoA synthetase
MGDASASLLTSRAEQYRTRTAIVDAGGSYSYDDLLKASAQVSGALLAGSADLREARIAFLINPGLPWAAVQWGIWRAGGIAVPLPLNTPAAELQYYVENAQAAAIAYDEVGATIAAPLAKQLGTRACPYNQMLASDEVTLPRLSGERRAMILYTSGTTNRPKGVVTTHANIAAQIEALVQAWEWSADDRILLCLPLHHLHGIMNVVGCALWSGATCEMLPRFDAEPVWERIAGGALTLFMAVPTIYVTLIAAWESASCDRQRHWSEAAGRLRLMVSGSAALPVSTLERWREITGHTLLERYGMTEIGMALSNPYRGRRVPGSVGRPLPRVEVRLVSECGDEVAPGTPGEIEVRGPSVFKEYWQNPGATEEAFRSGWFRTGDTAVVENDAYRILGRSNIDIIKTGGHKVSALEIEEVLRCHPAIAECAVVGVPDPKWGERVAAAVILARDATLCLDALRAWCRERTAAHKIPSLLLVLEALPRNAMGKVTKKKITDLFQKSC